MFFLLRKLLRKLTAEEVLREKLKEFPELYAIRSRWIFAWDTVRITDDLTELREVLLAPAGNSPIAVWISWQDIDRRFGTPCAEGITKIPPSNDKAIWGGQIVRNLGQDQEIRHVLIDFPGRAIIIYRRKGGFDSWIEGVTQAYELSHGLAQSERIWELQD